MKPSIGKHKNTSKARREFIKAGSAAAMGMMAVSPASATPAAPLPPREVQQAPDTRTCPETKTVHSVCLACNARCGVRGVVRDGRLVNISGNPYHPYNMRFSPIDYGTDVDTALGVESPVCGKALDTPQHIYSPYRLRRPLKRSGPRGSGQFEPIAWETLIQEISRGGQLFAHLGEDRVVPGIRDLLSDDPIDPADPYLGSRRNGLVFMTGRLQSGRKEFIDRFVKGGVGSVNRIGHTDICGLGFRMGNFALTGGHQVELKADPQHAEYILVFGANIYEALQPGTNTYGATVARRQADGSLAFSIVDPRATRAAAHARDWLPVKPGKDGALAMGIIQWMIDNQACNTAYLSAPNNSAARKKGFGPASDASHLVLCDNTHPDDGAFLRMHHIDPSLDKAQGQAGVVFKPGGKTPLPANAIDTADLDRTAIIRDAAGNSVRVCTAFALLKQEARAHSPAEYARACGVSPQQIAGVAKEFSSHGTRAAVTQYHGAGNYVNGTYAAYAVAALNVLVGSVNMKGGYLAGGGGCGSPLKGLFDLKSFPGKQAPGGVKISREKARYERTAEFAAKVEKTGSGYPARRPWFGFTKGGLCVEGLSGIDGKYPYPAQVLFTYLFNPVYSIPGGYRFKETLADTDKVPLHVSIDIAVNESNLYADYIVPDLSFAEGHYGWLTPHAPGQSFTGIRSPMIDPLTEKTPDGRPVCTETLLIDLAVSSGLPGFGKNAIPGPDGRHYDLFCAEDYYLRAFANIAHTAGLSPAPDTEAEYVAETYPLARHSHLLSPASWRQVCTMLARGGIFTPGDALYKEEVFTRGPGRFHLYNESLARTINSLTGRRFKGSPHWLPPADSRGRSLDDLDAAYPFSIVTYKHRLHTQSRTLWSEFSMEIQDENHVEMNMADATTLGLKDGDQVRLSSPGNPRGIRGRIKTTALVRPGCLAVSFHFGHTQFGASELTVSDGDTVFMGGASIMKGNTLIANSRFSKGLNFNDVALLDPHLDRTPMVDLAAGIPDFSSTRVAVARI
ncbi:MAG: molybdopterin dinucleotide binding domain-containing protein [Desulfobacter sp.]